MEVSERRGHGRGGERAEGGVTAVEVSERREGSDLCWRGLAAEGTEGT